MEKYLLTKEEIDKFGGLEKTHFLNNNAVRINKSLGDLTGLSNIGFHIIEIQPGFESTERHVHYFEEECVYVLEGDGEAIIGDQRHAIKAGDFIGYRVGGDPHSILNNSDKALKCIVVGQRLDHDVADYPNPDKRIYRNKGLRWNLVNISDIEEPEAGRKE